LIEKVKETIQKHHLFSKGERVIVGFSGGVDSLCLLHILAHLVEYNFELWALYINHCLRPSENIREERLLREVGRRFGIHTKQVTLNIPERLKQKSQSLQLLAREERYRIFLTFREEIGASKVALAHHRDDQTETILYRIIRGTGLDGLTGIPITRDGIFVRPLLYISRAEILAYATEQGLSWIEDSSNQKLIYQRNRIRRQLIPEIEQNYNPRFKEALLRLAELAAEQRNFMEMLVEEKARALIVTEPGRVGFQLEPFLRLHPYLQYCLLKKIPAEVDREYRLESNQLKRLLAKIVLENQHFKPVHIHRGVSVYFKQGIIFFERSSGFTNQSLFSSAELTCPVNIPGETLIPGTNTKLIAKQELVPTDWIHLNRFEAYLDIERFTLPAIVRYWRPGDSFRPLGTNGTQKLHDFFINNKIARPLRSVVPLLVDARGRIAWIIGYRVSEDFKVRDSKARAWHVAAVDGTGI
jgi:tRNA(Ile)-lysidine synthase